MNAFENKKRQKRAAEDITAEGFGTFLDLILYFGVVKYPQRHMPWQGDFMLSNEFVQAVMSFRKFSAILNCFRYTDTTRVPERERKEQNRNVCRISYISDKKSAFKDLKSKSKSKIARK